MKKGVMGIVMAVVVMGGSVEINCAGRSCTLGLGAMRAFGGPDTPADATVVSTGENRLTVKTGDGEKTFVIPETPKKEWKEQTELEKSRSLAKIAVNKALRPGMKVSILTSGENNLDGVRASGTVEGTVAGGEKGILLVNVEGIDGPMRFVADWEKGPNGAWRPVPKQVELFGSLTKGTKVRVAYNLEEHFRVKDLTVVGEGARREGDKRE